jgi:apolipoprotein N-acyltransferase
MSPTRRDGGTRSRVIAAGTGGLLLALAFPPFDVAPLAFVALIPLLWAWRGATPVRAAAYGFVFGFAFFAVLLYWFAFFGVLAFVLVPAVSATFVALTGVLVACFERVGVRSPWITAAAWVVPEALRGRWPLGGFPWGELGAALHDAPIARALASVGGVALVSYLVVVVNALLLDVVIALRARSVTRVAIASGAVAAVVVGAVIVDVARFQPAPTGQLRVALVQGNDQNRDIPVDTAAFVPITENHFRLVASLRGRYDLIVFPESALYGDPEDDPVLRDRIVALADAHDAAVLVNAAVDIRSDSRAYNANRLYEPDGELRGTYAKRHLVPFGEYLPARDFLTRLHANITITRDYKPGTDRVLFTVAGHRIGTMICFESAFASVSRDDVRDGAEALVVTTNNRSYRRSGNSAQHVALSQMRAAETGRPMLHASISGISAVIDAGGDVHRQTDLFRNAVVTTNVTTTTGRTPYVRFGDWVVWACGVALIATAAIARLRRISGARRPASGR